MSAVRRARWVADTVADTWRLQHRLAIAPSDLVLDVGSGSHPNPRANVLCDKFVSDGAERHGTAVVADRPFVVGDVQHLPFADKSFDFVICSHLLEHVRDPAAAIAELERVGCAGYIETPSAEWEKVVGYPFHRWLVSCHDGQLTFEPKRGPIHDESLREWFAAFQRELGINDRVWLARRRIGVYCWLRWTRRIPHQVLAHDERPEQDPFVAAELTWDPCQMSPEVRAGLFTHVLSWLGRRSRAESVPSPAQLDAVLRCPACRGQLNWADTGFACAMCRKSYPIDGQGRPWLLIEAAIG
jgi:SAM-dependent methyltransferase/uncharacterized protein YbaR (Trm112 family)